MKVLIIEDDQNTADMIKKGLISEGYTVEIANNGSEGAFMGKAFPFEAIVLDYSLPKKNGIEVCKEIRSSGKLTPIIFLSVEDDPDLKVSALDSGADDYMTKPFRFNELFARLRALTRRPPVISNPKICVQNLILDTEKKIVSNSGKEIRMTRKEFDLLEFFMRNTDSILSRTIIMEHVWTADSNPFSNTVEAHIRNLRKKINSPHGPNLIKNIPGRGYVMPSTHEKKRRVS